MKLSGVEYFNHLEACALTKHSKRAYISRFRQFCNFVAIKCEQIEINKETLQTLIGEYIVHLQQQGLKESSINRHLCTLAHFAKFSGLPHLCFPRFAEEECDLQILTFTEQTAVYQTIATLTSNRDRLILELLAYSALRPRELVALRISDIALENERIWLLVGGNEKRDVPLPHSMKLSMDRWLAERSAIAALDEELLFVTKKSKPIASEKLDCIVKAVGQKARVLLSCKRLQQTCIANWLSKTDDALLVAILSGSSLSTIHRHRPVLKEKLVDLTNRTSLPDKRTGTG